MPTTPRYPSPSAGTRPISGARLPAILAAALIAAPAEARLPADTLAQVRTLERILNRPGGAHATMFSAATECTYRHTYRKNIDRQTRIDRSTRIDFGRLDPTRARIEARAEGRVKMMIVPLRQDADDVTHTLKLIDGSGALHPQFLKRYGGTCSKVLCRATLTGRKVYITVVGDSADSDIETVAKAVSGLAARCAAANGEGG